VADLVALGVIVSSASCSGPQLTFKGGRVDATGGGRSGVPEPEQSANEYFDAMEKIGMNKTEGIQFIAVSYFALALAHRSDLSSSAATQLVPFIIRDSRKFKVQKRSP
jgi:hypothetical protein